MLKTKASRGRPKGTGIDDSDRIARLVEMLRIDPNLRPTTAIRVMGIADPSAIRRLRDKYKQFAAGSNITAASQARVHAHRVTGPVKTAVGVNLPRIQG